MLTQMVLQNPNASEKLVYDLIAETNTPDETIMSHVLTNSTKIRKWLKTLPENGKTILICGSGPSIKDELENIKEMKAAGAVIWALNNCANWLNQNDIIPNAQVIMDAQAISVDAIGVADEYYFASQVHPSLFDLLPDAWLWHSTHGNTLVDEQPGFPQHDDDYCMIGSAVSIGNTSMVLAYSQGFRDIHLLGYDSSNKGTSSHVIHQKWNDGEPMTIVDFDGKEYISSVTMRIQAQTFIGRAMALETVGCKVNVHGYGLLPDMWNNRSATEQEKYERMWTHDEYREIAPGEAVAERFIEIASPKGKVIDFGCGTGRGALKLHEHGVRVLLMDFTSNSRDPEAMHLPFVQRDLTRPIDVMGDYGYCTDVLEHIPPADVDTVIKNIMASTPRTFFQISTVHDHMGALIGHPLHLTVEPHEAWASRFNRLGYVVTWHENQEIASCFYVTTQTKKEIL